MSWIATLEAALAAPRGQQLGRFAAIRETLPPPVTREQWNTRFGPDSLFAAWTGSSVMRDLYRANAEVLRAMLTPGFTAIELGGGDGRLWQLLPEAEGELVLVDPAPEAHARVAEALPPGVRLTSHVAGMESVDLPRADVVLCSLTLHHIAGRDAAERAAHGLAGPGKLELLKAMRAAAPTLLLNEADVHCDLTLASGSEALREHMADSYLRRAGKALIGDYHAATEPDLRARLEAVIRHFCLEQLDLAEVGAADRDVYELDVAHWLELLAAAGYDDVRHHYTDDARLFVQYVAR